MSIREDLLKILDLDQILKDFAAQPNLPRVWGGRGIVWADGTVQGGVSDGGGSFGGTEDGGGSGEDGETEPDDGKDDDEDGSGSGQDGAPRPVPTDGNGGDMGASINKGDEMPNLGGLYDCNTGKCVNVRLHGQAAVPPGWGGSCSPPPAKNGEKIFIATFSENTSGTPPISISETAYFRTAEEAAAWAGSKVAAVAYPKIWEEDKDRYSWGPNGTKVTWDTTYSVKDGGGWGDSGYVYYVWKTQTTSGADRGSARGRVQNYTARGGEPLENGEWPSGMCSEIVSNGSTFAAACAEYDKNMADFAAPQASIELCDKDGNRVKISRTARGYEVYQAKFRSTAVINPDNFRVTGHV